MSFHMLNYGLTDAAGGPDEDMIAAQDDVFTRRGGAGGVDHYIFTDPINLIQAYHMNTAAVRARFNIPSWNHYGRQQIYPPNTSVTVPTNPQVHDLRDNPKAFPQNEEVAVEAVNSGAGGVRANVFLWVATPDWSKALTPGLYRQTVRFTAAAAGTANIWGVVAPIVFTDALVGGTYAVNGVEIFDAGTLAFRLLFPRGPQISGRNMRPGCLSKEAIGNIGLRNEVMELSRYGEWGKFGTFEPPQIQILANATAASVQEGRMDLTYLGSNPQYSGL